MQHTTNYNLNQWEDGDVVRREDFNADNAAVDAALKTVSDAAANVPEIVFGTYTGDGSASRTINLGKTPKAVLVFPSDGVLQRTQYNITSYYGGLVGPQCPILFYDVPILSVTDGGFLVYHTSPNTDNFIRTNEANKVFYYLAVL